MGREFLLIVSFASAPIILTEAALVACCHE